MKNVVLIVDPFSTGKMYAEKFYKLGYQCFSVLSGNTVPSFFTQRYDNTFFENEMMYSVDDVKAQFSKGDVAAVVIGSETGVIIGELLADYFNVSGNPIKSSIFRRDKFLMWSQLSKNGLDYIQSKVITKNDFDISEFPDYTAYILKPVNSAGTDNVCFL